MDNKELSTTLKKDAVLAGLCQQWTDEWADDSTRDDLLDKYIRGIDFCLKHNYPAPDFIKQHFDADYLCEKGVYVDLVDNIQLKPVNIILGNSIIKAEVSSNCNQIYACHNSELYLDVCYKTKIWVTVMDYAKVHINCRKGSKVYLHKYSSSCFIEYVGDVSVKQKIGFFGEPLRR